MSAQIFVEHERNEAGGRFAARLGDGLEAEMTYRMAGAQVMAIEHTLVPQSFRGQGIAEKLLDAARAYAARENLLIQPVCSYVVAQFRRHPEWAHLKA